MLEYIGQFELEIIECIPVCRVCVRVSMEKVLQYSKISNWAFQALNGSIILEWNFFLLFRPIKVNQQQQQYFHYQPTIQPNES